MPAGVALSTAFAGPRSWLRAAARPVDRRHPHRREPRRQRGFGASLPAGQAAKLISDQIPAQSGTAGSSFTLIFSSANLSANDPAFQQALQDAVAPLSGDPRVAGVRTPYSPIQQSAFISRDSHQALVIVALTDDSLKAQAYINQVSGEVHPGPLSVVATGQVPINLAFNNTLENDLQRAEYVALPITLLLLILIFAAIVAALLPLGVGLLAIAGGFGGTVFSRASPTSRSTR